MVTIAGGKLTTARVMAQQLVDRVGEILREEHGLPAIPVSSTATMPLSGGDPTGAARAAVLLGRNGASDAVTARLVTRYGSNALHHAARLEKAPASGTALDDTGLSRVEVELALESEMARTVSDVLIRRTGTSTWPIGSGSDTAERVSRLVADHLDLDETTRIAQLNAYRAEVARNLP